MNQELFNNIINNIKQLNLKVESLIITQNDKQYKHFFVPEKLKDVRSISKTITCLALGVTISKGYFKDGIETYIMPYFEDIKITNKNNLQNLNNLQIKHLITFTAGYDKQILNHQHLNTTLENIKLVEYALNYPLKYKPGEKFVFSNAPMYLLSIIIEKETKMMLKDFIAKEIIKANKLFLVIG